MLHTFPKQMRYQAALLPDGSFPRASLSRPQPAFGTNRKSAAHGGTIVTTFRATKGEPETRLQSRPALTKRWSEHHVAKKRYIKVLPHLTGRYGGTAIERFWQKVERRGPNDCWDWKASRFTSGYGRFKLTSYLPVSANRVALALETGIEPEGLQALHGCDRPCCCNPAHLRWGTAAENSMDKVERGRASTGDQRGAKNGAAKMSDDDLITVVDGFRRGLNNKQIAHTLPVGHATISKIRRGHMWRARASELGWEACR